MYPSKEKLNNFLISNYCDMSNNNRYTFAKIILTNGERHKLKSHPQGCMVSLNSLSEKTLRELYDFMKQKTNGI